MLDENGYPSKQDLRIIQRWDITKKPVVELIQYIKSVWQYADCGYFDLKGKRILRLRLSTAGWSGNESVIDALQKNRLFWMVYWQKSERGGHYWFRINLKIGA